VTGRALAAALLAVAASATASVASAASAGSLDSTFSGDGKVTTRFEPGSHFVGGLAIQPDGKILVAGRVKGRFALARYNPNGTLDQTWGGDGLVETSLTRGTDGAQAVAVQANGKVVATGFAAGKGGRFAVVRYKSDGRLDPTFSGDGVKATDFTKRLDEAFDVAIQADGKIVLAGCTRVGMFLGGRFAIARYTSDGKLDLTLGGDGKVTTNFTTHNDCARGIAIQSDGKIVAAGGAAIFTFLPESMFALARYNADGTRDSSFDGDGKLMTSFGTQEEQASGVAIQADGKIVAAGHAGQTQFTTDTQFALARYDMSGTLDTSFDGDGLVLTNFTNGFDGADAGVAIQSDGKIVAAGSADASATTGTGFALSRYTAAGSPDTTFSGDGKVKTEFTGRSNSATQLATALAIQVDGKIVVAGTVGEFHKFAVARYIGP
jgi:uncharacterized delta-60 repeat protein